MRGMDTAELEVRARGEAGGAGRIRVLQFLPAFGPGGTERQVLNLARALDPARFELRFGCFRRWGEFLGEVTDLRVPVTEYPIRKLYNARAWRERLRFTRYLRHERIQVVHTYNFYGNAFALPAARLARIPVVVASIRDIGGGLAPLHQRAHRVVCRLAHRIVVNAEAIRQYLTAQGYDPRKIVVIRNGVDLSRFSGRRGDSRLRQDFGLPPGAPLVAVISRLIRMKGVEHFLEAAAVVARRVPDVWFLVVGEWYRLARNDAIVRDDTYRHELERLAARLGLDGRIVFTGFRPDVPELLAEVAVCVLPSLGEGLPNAVLEAMAAGVPVVATRVGGIAEAVEDGVTGLLVPPRDASALARAIYGLLGDQTLAARFGAAGRERVVRHFSIERYVRDTAALYAQLLESK